jgi:rhamnose transport system ATP-binding protein
MVALPPPSSASMIARPEEVAAAPLLRVAGATKSYAGVRALRDASFTLRAGEIHALIGENGAGKSTFIKLLTGAVQADGGEIAMQGTPLAFASPREARARGIVAIYQQPALFPELSVAENLAIGQRVGMAHRLEGAAPPRGGTARAGRCAHRPRD